MSYKTLKKWLIWERKQEKKMGCLLPRASNMAENQEVEDVTLLLLPCAVCGRTFRPEVLSKHAAVCERQHTKKRKKFDSAKQRIQGTELAEFLGPPPIVSKPKPPSPKKVQSRWKEKHEALVRTIRDEQIKPLDHSQCPHCDRYFGPKAFDRHEAWCKEQHTKKQVQTEDVTKAKLRLHARTKYRAPSFKSQRTVTKEKYSSTRPPVSSSSSTLPSAAIEHHERLPRNSSSISASEIGLNTSMTGLGNVGRKSPALTRRNSIPKPVRRADDEPLKKDIPKRLEDNTSSLPTLTRNSRAGSLSSQGSDCRSGTTSSHSVGPCETGMGSAATATPLYETKPTIKTSYSTNSLNRRWSPSGGEQITGGGTGAQDDSALSKFCHECGGRYPVAGAKFCCLCGVRRLAI